MLLLGKVRWLGAIFSLALLIDEAAPAATNLPNSASNLVLRDVTSVDKVVPSESVVIAYDKSTLFNVPSTLEEHPTSQPQPSSTHGLRSTSRATFSSTPEVPSTAEAALSPTVPLTPEEPSTPKAAFSSTPKAAQSSLVTQTSRIASTPMGAEPVSLQVQPQTKAAFSPSLPPTPSTSGSPPSFPEASSTPLVHPESNAALSSSPTTFETKSTSRAALSSSLPSTQSAKADPSSSPKVPTTYETKSTSRSALSSSLPSTPSTKAALTSNREVPTTLPEHAESKYASSSSLPPTPSAATSSSAPEAASALQIQRESKAALRPVPDGAPTLKLRSKANEPLPSTFLPTPAPDPSLSFSPRSSPMASKAALNSIPEMLTTPDLRLSQQQLIAISREASKATNMSVAAMSSSLSTASLTSELAPRATLLSRPNANLTLDGTASTSPASRTVPSSPSTPLEALKSAINSTASHLLRMSSAYPSSISTPALFDEADPATILRVQRTTPRPFSRQAAAGGPCQGEGRCVPLSYCRLLSDLLDRSCLVGDRVQQLTCGYGNREPFVCCPPGAFTSIWQTGPTPIPPPTFPPTPPPTHPPSPPPPPSPLPQKCGIPQVFNWRADYHGLGSQPWVARVGFKSVDSGAMQYPCCGSIISARVILTAAHCALAKTVGHKLSSVRVGEFDAAQDPDCTTSFCAHKVQDVAVSHVVVHPAYERATFVNDIALLVLRQPLNFTLTTQPVCLDGGGRFSPMPYEGYVGHRAKLVGWGLTAGQTDVPDLQQQLDLPVVPVEQCARLYDEVVPITSQHMCVGGEPGRDACSGFGGAPLVMLDSSSHTKYYQVGMVSFGSKQCGAAGVPSVYTRIDKYFEWIRTNMNY